MDIDIDIVAEFLNKALFVVMAISYTKHLMGYHFPWERCSCCGEKYRDHKENENESMHS